MRETFDRRIKTLLSSSATVDTASKVNPSKAGILRPGVRTAPVSNQVTLLGNFLLTI